MGDLSAFPPSAYRHTPSLGENENLIPFERFVTTKLIKGSLKRDPFLFLMLFAVGGGGGVIFCFKNLIEIGNIFKTDLCGLSLFYFLCCLR